LHAVGSTPGSMRRNNRGGADCGSIASHFPSMCIGVFEANKPRTLSSGSRYACYFRQEVCSKIAAKWALTSKPPGLRWGRIANDGETLCIPSGSWLGRVTKLAGFQCPARKQDKAAPSGRRMTFIRHEVGGMSLTPNIKMERWHTECVRLRHFAEAIVGFLPFGASSSSWLRNP
jgi:hypothetical protein